MRVLNFGSLNIDYVYQVNDLALAGETILANQFNIYPGGKGLNQSIALACAGSDVWHAGKIGKDGNFLISVLEKSGVNCSLITQTNSPSGHALIQVNSKGENSIVLYPGTNFEQTILEIDLALGQFQAGDLLVLQNEINLIPELIIKAKQKNLLIAFNAAPYSKAILNYPLNLIDYFILNEIEAKQLTGSLVISEVILKLRKILPQAKILLTLGAAGAIYQDSLTEIHVPAEATNVVDTTAAGDTMIGYFLTEIIRSSCLERSLKLAAKAAAVCVSRHGASSAIPKLSELE